jgi:polar amino acid transport system substrate-binding protein
MKDLFKLLSSVLIIVLAMNLPAYAKELRIWTLSEPPGNFVGENGELTGLTVDYVHEIQKRIGNTDDIDLLPWKRIYRTALREPDIVFFSVARTPEREDKFHWITLVMRKPWALYGKKGSKLQIMNLEDAKKVKAIGVMRGDVRADWLRQQGFTNLDEVAVHEQNVEKLMRGKVDLVFYSPQGMAHVCRESEIDFHEFEPVLFPHASLSHIAMSKNGTRMETVKLWQETAQQIKNDGTFARLAENWAKYTREKNGVEAEVKDGALNFWKE